MYKKGLISDNDFQSAKTKTLNDLVASPARTSEQKLEDLQSMNKKGLISNGDYEAAKTAVLNAMSK